MTWSILAIHRCHIHGVELMAQATGSAHMKGYDLRPFIRSNWPDRLALYLGGERPKCSVAACYSARNSYSVA